MLNKVFLSKMKQQLLKEKEDLTEKSLSHKEFEVDTDGDETDEIQANILIELQNQLNIRNRDKLIKINDAICRIDDQTYGICQDCEDNIPEKRLCANPYFLICVSCAEEREMETNQRKK